MTPSAELAIELERYARDTYALALRFTPPGSQDTIHLLGGKAAIIAFDFEQLHHRAHDTVAYGRYLSASLLSDLVAKMALIQALSMTQVLQVPLRVRLAIDPTALELHTLRWETLRDPLNDEWLSTNNYTLFSRYVAGHHPYSRSQPPAAGLHALVAIANPSDVMDYRPARQPLTPLDVTEELARIRTSLGNIPITPLATCGSVNLATITSHLQTGYDILYLVAHGAIIHGKPHLWLEQADCLSTIVPGHELVAQLQAQPQPPRLVLLSIPQSPETSVALGLQLAASGIPAVLVMQEPISLPTFQRFMSTFFSELQQDGQVDRAMAVARRAVRHAPDWWIPVLLMGCKDGQLWPAAAT